MKKIYQVTRLSIPVLLLSLVTSSSSDKALSALKEVLNQHVTICGASSPALLKANANGKYIPVLPGWGHHAYRISTKNDSSQIYFNQGLSFYYGYHFKEALASFKEAARFDTSCAMAYWGQALAQGPYYNAYYYQMKKEVLPAVQLMQIKRGNASSKEKLLINAMQQRYSSDFSNADRTLLDSTYAAAMSNLVKEYPEDNDIKALYVDAVMLRHKWDFWSTEGKSRSWTPKLVGLCQNILKSDPVHPAALHYYIHLTEASNHPELALHSADVLKDEMPGVGHMVHMATHMYQRNGLFSEGVAVNESSIQVSNQEDSLARNLELGQNKQLHVFAVQSYCAMTAGMYTRGLPVYMRARTRLLQLSHDIPNNLYSQYTYMLPQMAFVRLGKWGEIFRSTRPDKKWKYALVLDDFAKGLAYLHEKNLDKAKACLADLQINMQDSLLAVRELPFNKPVQCAQIAEQILKGEILYLQGNKNAALKALSLAVENDDKLIYREPREWLIPARQYLGAYLLKLHRIKEAEQVYKEDLIKNPGDGWSLVGLRNSYLAQHRSEEAKRCKSGYDEAFKAADRIPETSVFL